MDVNPTIFAAVAVLCTAAANAEGNAAKTYPVTSDWTAVSSAGYADGTGDLTAAKGWTERTDGFAAVSNGVIRLSDDTAEGGKLTYTPAAPASACSIQTLCLHVDKVRCGVRGNGNPDGAQAAIRAGVANATTNWYAWSAGVWVKLTGAAPEEGGSYDVRIEIDAAQGVRYSVKQGSGAYAVLADGDGQAWVANGKSSATCIADVTLRGNGGLTGIDFTQTGTVTMSDAQQQKMAEQGITDLNAKAANGNPNWENLVLGLDGRQASAKPVVQPVQTADAAKLTLKMGGVAVDSGSGATVKYKAIAYDAAQQKVAESALAEHTQNVSIGLPESGVRYYKFEVVTTPAN